ncbi:MAG: hypothetical protein JXO44_15150 [Clostridia bacterium]|nr:hypothetical protein [Clostridia bacterium]
MRVLLNSNEFMQVDSGNLSYFFEKLALINRLFSDYKIYLECDGEVVEDDYNVYLSKNIGQKEYLYIKIFDEFDNAVNMTEVLTEALTILENDILQLADEFYLNDSSTLWNALIDVLGGLDRVFSMVDITSHTMTKEVNFTQLFEGINAYVSTLNEKFLLLTDYMKIKDTVAIADMLKWEVAKTLEAMNNLFADVLMGGSYEE